MNILEPNATFAERQAYFEAIKQRDKDANEGDTPQTAQVVPIKSGGPTLPNAPGENNKQNTRAALADAAREASKQAALDDLEAVVSHYTTFSAQTGETLAIIKSGRVDVVPVQSEAFGRRLKLDLFHHTGKTPSNTHLELLKDLTLERAEHRVRRVYKRIAQNGDNIILDLGDNEGRRLRVTAQGWQVEPGGEDFLYRRGKSYGTIDVPEATGDAREAWRWLRPLLSRVPKQEHFRLVAWLVASALSEADYPIVLLVGPEGSAKSTLAQNLATVLDPPQGLLPTVSTGSAKDIIAGIQGRHVCVLDNAPGKLNGDIEDTLCRISTGAQFEERLLYTNFDVASAELHAPLIVTAISHPFRQRDTRNRTIAIEIEALRDGFKRRTDVVDEIEHAIGQIRGAVLFFISTYLRHRDTILALETIPHRMVDWAVAGEAIARELGAEPGKFFAQIERKQRDDASDYLEGDLVGAALLRALQHWAAQAEKTEDLPANAKLQDLGWVAVQNAQGELTIIATPTAIQKELMQRTLGNIINLPNTARATTGAIQRLQGVLNRAGIRATSGRSKKARWWTFTCLLEVLTAVCPKIDAHSG